VVTKDTKVIIVVYQGK